MFVPAWMAPRSNASCPGSVPGGRSPFSTATLASLPRRSRHRWWIRATPRPGRAPISAEATERTVSSRRTAEVLDVVGHGDGQFERGPPLPPVEQLDPHRAPGRLHRGVVVAVAGSDQGACGWIVSPRASISTNWSMRLERVSGFLAFPIL